MVNPVSPNTAAQRGKPVPRAREAHMIASFRRSVRKDPSMAHRANLDPELSDIVKKGNSEYGMLLP